MKIFDVRTRVDDSGEYILGLEDTGSHACYLIYGTMKPGEKGRLLKPGGGHEELILAARGNFLVSGHIEGELKESLDPEVAALSMMSYVCGVKCMWLNHRDHFSLKDMGEQIIQVFLNGLVES